MAEHIDREKYMKDKYNCDLIQIDNVELVPLYQIIDKLEQSIERTKIDKAIEIAKDSISACFELGLDERAFGMREILNIFEENIGES